MTGLLIGSAWNNSSGAALIPPPNPPPDGGTDPDPEDPPPVEPEETAFFDLLDTHNPVAVLVPDSSGNIVDRKGVLAGGSWLGLGMVQPQQPSLLLDDAAPWSVGVDGTLRCPVPGHSALDLPAFTVIAIFQRRTLSTYPWMVIASRDDQLAGASQPGGWSMAHTTSGAPRWFVRNSSGESVVITGPDSTVPAGDIVMQSGSSGPGGLELFLGGTSVASDATALGSVLTSALTIGSWRDGATPFNGAIHCLAIVPSQLSAAQLGALAALVKSRVRWANDLTVSVAEGETTNVAPSPKALMASATPTVTVTVQPANATATVVSGEIQVEGTTESVEDATGRYTLTDSNGVTSPAVLRVTVGPPEPVVPPAPTDIFRNPFNKLSIHHRPLGAGAAKGIPAGYNGSGTLVDAAVPGSRGRLSIIMDYRCSAGPRYDKLHISNETGSNRTITWSGGQSGNNLPVTLRLPANAGLELYQSPAGDSNPGVFDAAGSSSRAPGKYHLFFGYQDNLSNAALCNIYPLNGLDFSGSDQWDRGSSAASIRWPSTILQDYEIMPSEPSPIYHPLNVAVTRNQSGVAAALHVLSKRRCWPAMSVDGSQTDNGNGGDIPYGTLGFIDATDYAYLLGAFTWTPRQRVILDVHRYYGVYFLDGSHVTYTSGGVTGAVAQVRTSAGISQAVKDELRIGLNRIRPYLWPLLNGRTYASETEIHTNGLPYRGGGGPINANSVNSAFDA